MKLQFKYAFLMLCLTGAFFACKDDKDTDVKPEEEKKDSIVNEYVTIKVNGVVEIKSMPVPVASFFNYNLFSFSKMGLVGAGEDSVNTAAWDVGFQGAGLTTSPNWGGTAPGYWDGVDKFAMNPSDVSVVGYEDTTFDAIKAAPPATAFMHTLAMSPQTPVYNTETGELAYFDFPKRRVFVFKLNDGRYVKFQYVSYYKGAPETPTAEIYQKDAGYWTFKYFISAKGSTDLSTK
ncbi:HmuY family protein [Chitinophaga sancti]|uniref:HmuY family protein n=1 Tax=Chitinophaga sancti TaxID=1004 RepID=UPI003F7A3547